MHVVQLVQVRELLTILEHKAKLDFTLVVLPGARLRVVKVMRATVVTFALRLRSRGLRFTQRPFSVLVIF